MARYEIQGPDGSTFKIDAPNDATDEQLQQIAADAYARLRPGVEAPPKPGIVARVRESITGEKRMTPEVAALPEWTTMPELNSVSGAGQLWNTIKTGVGTAFAGPDEIVSIIKANSPNTTARKDQKGNWILRSGIDGKEYAIPPGFSWGDIPRAIAGVGAFTPAGRAATIPGAVAANAATQGVIEAAQAGAGGEFNVEDIAMAGAVGGAIPAAGRVISAAAPVVQRVAAPAVERVRGVIQRGRAAPSPAAVPEVAPTAMPTAAAVPDTAPPPVAAAVPDKPPPVAQPAAVADDLIPESAAPAEMPTEDLSALIRKASGGGVGSGVARERLAELAATNREALEASQRLGIELPADVFSDNPQLRAAIGLTRSEAGSAAEAGWRTTVSNATNRADELMQEFDAVFIGGTPSMASVSARVRDSLKGAREQLSKESTAIFDEVTAAIPKQTQIDLPNLRELMKQTLDDVGGDAAMLSQKERALLSLVEEGKPVTYEVLNRARQSIGDAMKGRQSEYGDVNSAMLKRMYAALAKDQLQAAETVGGAALRDKLRGANLLYKKQKALEERIVQAFGDDVEGSIANKLRTAVTSGAKGDIAGFNKIMKTIPEDLRRETIATAVANASRATRGGESVFGFAEFVKFYQGLRANPEMYKTVVDSLGKDAAPILRDLFEVSKRITTARGNVLQTGKANQALKQMLTAESLLGKVMESTAGRAAATGAAAVGAGPAGAVLSVAMQNMMKSGRKDAVKAAGDMFKSEEFQRLAVEAAVKPEVSRATVKRVVLSDEFKKFADAIRLPRKMSVREQWLLGALQAAKPQTQEEPQQ